MIKTIIDLLQSDNFYGVSRNVDIAKGLYKKPSTLKEASELLKRTWYGR